MWGVIVQETGTQFATVKSARTALVRPSIPHLSKTMLDFPNLSPNLHPSHTHVAHIHGFSCVYVQGHDRRGRLVLVQMEGETWSSGVDLYELADLLVELGGAAPLHMISLLIYSVCIYDLRRRRSQAWREQHTVTVVGGRPHSADCCEACRFSFLPSFPLLSPCCASVVNAINLDGGGSATLTQNHSLVSDPSWLCDKHNPKSLFRCVRLPVLSPECTHCQKIQTQNHTTEHGSI